MNGCTAILDDFKTLSIYSNAKKKTSKLINQDKGQKNEVIKFVEAICSKGKAPISYPEIHSTSLVTLKIIESIRNNQKIDI
jgi:hypothetical protein